MAAVGLGLAWGVAVLVTDHHGLVTFVPMLVLLLASGMALFRGPSRERLRVDPAVPAMYAPARGPARFQTFALAWLPFQLVTYADRWGPDLFWWALLVGSVVIVVLVSVDLWRRVPLIEVTPDGIGSGGPYRSVFVPWSALATGQPLGATAEMSTLSLRLARPELVERGGWRWRGRPWDRRRETLVLHEVDAAPEFLAAAIRHYLDHPEHRPFLGTTEEFARLPRSSGGGGPGYR